MSIFASARPGVVQESPPDEPLQSLTDAAVSMTDSGDIGDQEPLAVMDLLSTIETPGAASAILRAMRGLEPRPGALQAMAAAFDEIRDRLIELATEAAQRRRWNQWLSVAAHQPLAISNILSNS